MTTLAPTSTSVDPNLERFFRSCHYGELRHFAFFVFGFSFFLFAASLGAALFSHGEGFHFVYSILLPLISLGLSLVMAVSFLYWRWTAQAFVDKCMTLLAGPFAVVTGDVCFSEDLVSVQTCVCLARADAKIVKLSGTTYMAHCDAICQMTYQQSRRLWALLQRSPVAEYRRASLSLA